MDEATDKTTRGKLLRLQRIHEELTELQGKEDELAADLATSTERGVRTAMARALGVTVEALRLRYGPVKSLADTITSDK
ncbi:hypothetical protein ACFY2M_19020 [Streptomyces sp. NPDC001276]|uniref:hypothetical protein n=1 Tax=Streptomyces sp. NPDC001276 TaxID=3364555 RepID=UPI0036797DBE